MPLQESAYGFLSTDHINNTWATKIIHAPEESTNIVVELYLEFGISSFISNSIILSILNDDIINELLEYTCTN